MTGGSWRAPDFLACACRAAIGGRAAAVLPFEVAPRSVRDYIPITIAAMLKLNVAPSPTSAPGRLPAIWMALLLCLAALPAPAEEATRGDVRRQVMVDYIVHFAHHLQWPIEVFNGSGAPFRICVMGEDELVAPLNERLHRHRIQGRMVALEKVNGGELMRARSCQIVVMEGMDRASLAKAISALEFFPVLTVSDTERFVLLGGMVEFAGSGSNMALQLNKTRLDRAELKEGSSLFRLSRQIN